MQRPKKITLTPADADDDGISTSQTPSGAGDLTITGALASGGVATLDIPRRVLITAAADESGHTFTIYGTAPDGHAISEVVTGPNTTTATSLKDYKTVTRVAINAAATGAVKVGTGGKISSPWIPFDVYDAAKIAIGVVVSGTINYSIEQTMDDPWPNVGQVNPPTDVYLTPFAHPILDGQSTNQIGVIEIPIRAWRLTVNSYSSGASAIANAAYGPSDMR